MPQLNGWTKDDGDRGWTFGGSYYAAEAWLEVDGRWRVRVWPRRNHVPHDITEIRYEPDGKRYGMAFDTEPEARAFVESWSDIRWSDILPPKDGT